MMSDNNRHIRLFFNIRQDRWVYFFIVIAVLAVYGQVRYHSFVDYDNNTYITENRQVQAGLTVESVVWAFTLNKNLAYWHPLTWISHITDCHFYGLDAGMHGLTNVMIHIANSLLLFSLLGRMTGELWKSAFVAAVFALHPLNVESVAWVAERKNVLSSFFWMLTLLAYTRYAERPGTWRYLCVLLMFILGLLTKPMLITLPFVLLLLDYWPIGRFDPGHSNPGILRLIAEKIPLMMLSAVSVMLSIVSLRHTANVVSTDTVPMTLRIANALLSYINYIEKLILPRNLAAFYPHPHEVPLWKSAGAGFLLICLSVLIIRASRRNPCLGVGWLWYLGTFVPAIGLVQAGIWPAMADRWIYIPSVGLLMIIAYGIPELIPAFAYRKKGLVLSAAILFPLLMTATWSQVRYWANNFSFFSRMLEVTSDNFLAHNGMGLALAAQGKLPEAMTHYRESIRIKPDYDLPHNNLGLALMEQGKLQEAVLCFERAIRINPHNIKYLNNLGIALAKQGKTAEALKYFEESLKIDPDHPMTCYNIANIMKSQGKIPEALSYFRKAVSLKPDFESAHYNLATTLAAQENTREAIIHFLKALEITPDDADAHIQLGILLIQKGFVKEAAAHFRKSLEIRPDTTGTVHNNLGVALLHEGKIKEASLHFQKALQIKPDDPDARNNLKKVLDFLHAE